MSSPTIDEIIQLPNWRDVVTDAGVKVRSSGNVHLLKYEQLGADWSTPFVHQCRGLIIVDEGKRRRVVSRPFDKFFNLKEPRCTIDDVTPEMVVEEKADGTCIQVWHHGGYWRVSTLGSLETGAHGNMADTFAELFLRLFDPSGLLPGFTHVFELCTQQNRIVNEYEEDHVVYLGSRSIETGACAVIPSVDARRPQRVSHDGMTADQAYDLANTIADDPPPTWGTIPEGFVIWDGFYPVAKVKSNKYLQLHRYGGGDPAASRNAIVEAVVDGNIDDAWPVLSEQSAEYAQRCMDAVASWRRTALAASFDLHHSQLGDDRKSYAMEIKKLPSVVQPFLFSNLDSIRKDADLAQHWDLWVPQQRSRLIKWLKESVNG